MNEKKNKSSTQTTPSVQANPKDIEEHKAIAAIGYISILCFVPLLLKKDSPYAQFHAKNGLALFVIEVASFILSWTIVLSPVSAILLFICLLVSLYGIYMAMDGQQKEIPGVSHLAKLLNL